MPTGIEEVKSLRSLAVAAAIDKIFKQDKSVLPKYYQLGILPVKVVDDIYCQWVKAAITQSKENIQSAYDSCSMSWIHVRVAKIALSDAKDMIYQAKSKACYDQDIQKCTEVLKQISNTLRAKCTAHEKTVDDEIKNLEELKSIFTKEERAAIIRANPSGGMRMAYVKLSNYDLLNNHESQKLYFPI